MLYFRDTIAPSGGNNDAIRASLVELLYFAHEMAHDERVGQHCNIDVMDFIYREMYEAMVSRTSIPYAPYIMMLIKGTLRDQKFSDDVLGKRAENNFFFLTTQLLKCPRSIYLVIAVTIRVLDHIPL